MNTSDIVEHINKLKNEYERIRNYEYNDDDQFEVMNRKMNIETVFYLLNIKFDEFDR